MLKKHHTERGTLLSVVLFVLLVWYTLVGTTAFMTTLAFAGGIDASSLLFIVSMFGSIIGLNAMWNIKKWGLYTYILFSIILIILIDNILIIIPALLLAYLVSRKWKFFK